MCHRSVSQRPDSPFLCGDVMTACYGVQCSEVPMGSAWGGTMDSEHWYVSWGDIAVRMLAEILGLDGF